MKNTLTVNTKSCHANMGRRFLALLLSCVMMFSLSACGGQKTTNKAEEIKPVKVKRKPEPQALQTVNEATAIALRQYIYARLDTEEFLTADTSSMIMEGDREELWTGGGNYGTYYVYEWRPMGTSAPIFNTEGIESIVDIP